MRRAVALERQVFRAESPEAVHRVLMDKAACYAEAGAYDLALETLERIKLYLLDPAERTAVLRARSEYGWAAGRSDEALAAAEEGGFSGENPARQALMLASCGRLAEAEEAALRCPGVDAAAVRKLFRHAPRPKQASTAMWLSLLPGAGNLYLGEPGRAASTLVGTAASAAFLLWQCADGCWITGLLGGGLLLKATWFDGNIVRNTEAVDAVNADRRAAFVDHLSTILRE